jgi:hypothetical protein
MISFLVFVTSFLSLFTVTIIFPDLPPGYIIIEFFRNPEINYHIAGISGDVLISALINGISWSVIITLIFFFWRGPEKGKRNLPVWIPGYAKSNNSKDSS